MDKATFGSIEQYKMLEFLTEKISLMDIKHRNYISSVIQDINATIAKTKMINDITFKKYILNLIHNDFNKRINIHIKDKYEKDVTTYLMNYLYAKIKNSKYK